jgi:P27 family predicted phage terminase small subunit
MRGRKPKPTKLKLVTGNPGRRSINAAEPSPSNKAPDCPAWLDKDAKAKWQELAPELSALGLLTIVDGDVLAAYCQAWAEFKAATETIQRDGRTFSTETGYLAQHPAVSQQRSAWQAIKAFASLFGLDPSSRSRLHIGGKAEDKDPFEAFLAG